MKNKTVAWLLLIVLLSFAGVCPALSEDVGSTGSEALEENAEDWLTIFEEDDGEIWGEMLDEDDYWANSHENILRAAMEVYSWFEVQPLDIDSDMPSASGAMWRVLDERFDTYEALSDFVYFYFSDEIAQSLLSRGVYLEEDGALYTKGALRAINENMLYFDVSVIEESENRIAYKVTVKYSGPEEERPAQTEYTYLRDRIDGEWRFTIFPFFW